MKLLTIIIPAARQEPLLATLRALEVPGFSLMRVEGAGRHEALVGLATSVRVELLLPDERLEAVAGALHARLHTGRPEDGVIYWTEVAGGFHLADASPVMSQG